MNPLLMIGAAALLLFSKWRSVFRVRNRRAGHAQVKGDPTDTPRTPPAAFAIPTG